MVLYPIYRVLESEPRAHVYQGKRNCSIARLTNASCLDVRLSFSSVPSVSHQVLILRKTENKGEEDRAVLSGVGGTGSSPASQIRGHSSVSAS